MNGAEAFMVHVRFPKRYLLQGERAFKMLVSFDEPLRESFFSGEVFMTGVVLGSTGEGVLHRVKEELHEVGVEGLHVTVRGEGGESEPHFEGREEGKGEFLYREAA